jgi:hypothetical protein
MRLRILAATVTALVAGLLLPGAANAVHYTGPTKTVPWVTHLAPGGHIPPKDSADVTWPETLLVGPPKCGTVTQYDTYKYGTDAEKAEVEALIAHGTLNRPNSGPWTDETFIVSWVLNVEAPCQAPSPSPSPPASNLSNTALQVQPGAVGKPPAPIVLGETTTQLPSTGVPYLLLIGISLGLIGTGAGFVYAARRF